VAKLRVSAAKSGIEAWVQNGISTVMCTAAIPQNPSHLSMMLSGVGA
jgi:hypothetical protein